MGDRRRRARLPPQPHGILGRDLAQGLDRHAAAEGEVGAAVDHPHAADADPPLEAELSRQDVGHERRFEPPAAGAAEHGVGGVERAALGALLGQLGRGGAAAAPAASGRPAPGAPAGAAGRAGKACSLLQLQHPGGVAGDGVQELAVLPEEGKAALLLAEPDQSRAASRRGPGWAPAAGSRSRPATGAPSRAASGAGSCGFSRSTSSGIAGVRDAERERRGDIQPPGPVAGIDQQPRAGVEHQQGGPLEVEREVDLPRDQVGEAGGVPDGADALDEQRQDVPGVVLLAEEAPVDGLEERLAVAQRRRADQDGRDQEQRPRAREEIGRSNRSCGR